MKLLFVGANVEPALVSYYTTVFAALWARRKRRVYLLPAPGSEGLPAKLLHFTKDREGEAAKDLPYYADSSRRLAELFGKAKPPEELPEGAFCHAVGGRLSYPETPWGGENTFALERIAALAGKEGADVFADGGLWRGTNGVFGEYAVSSSSWKVVLLVRPSLSAGRYFRFDANVAAWLLCGYRVEAVCNIDNLVRFYGADRQKLHPIAEEEGMPAFFRRNTVFCKSVRAALLGLMSEEVGG